MFELVTISDEMKETDVREAVVRPLLVRLGYAFGKPANIRTEVPLRYDHVFLGHKKPGKDPKVEGRADYICEAVSYGRWVIEAKKPTVVLDVNASHQAYTYAAHPEVAALYYVTTNGKEFHVYRIGHPDSPILKFLYEEIESRFLEIKNLLGPEAIRKHYEKNKIELGKPLAEGLAPKVKIIGGFTTYRKNYCSKPLLQNTLGGAIDGARSPILGGEVYRQDNGLIRARVEHAGSNSALDAMNKAIGVDVLTYDTADDLISTDKSVPSIFQNLISMNMEEGLTVPSLFGNPGAIMPMTIEVVTFTQAVGYFNGEKFLGAFTGNYEFKVKEIKNKTPQIMVMANIFDGLKVLTEGDFEIIFAH